MEIAQGVSEMTGLPIYKKVVRRNSFKGSQTNKGRWDRQENVEHVFELTDATAVSNKHLLLIDDVITTGATCIACAKALCQSGNIRISILALGFAKS
jgi:predicted amidophosphoribosyltransferase